MSARKSLEEMKLIIAQSWPADKANTNGRKYWHADHAPKGMKEEIDE